jgi:hypothetical protein
MYAYTCICAYVSIDDVTYTVEVWLRDGFSRTRVSAVVEKMPHLGLPGTIHLDANACMHA